MRRASMRPGYRLAALVAALIAVALITPALLLSYSVDDKSFYDGVSDMSAFETSDTVGIALDSQGGLRLATDGTPTVSSWSSRPDFLGNGAAGPLEGLLTAEASGEDSATGALRLRATPLALDNDVNNPVFESESSSTVRADGYEVHGPSVVKVGPGDYRMYYTGVAADGYRQRVFEATSTNGTSWTKLAGPGFGGSVLDLGPVGSFDEYGLVRPAVTYEASSATPFRMWYGGLGRDSGAIGYATSVDGLNWTKWADTSGTPLPVVGPGVFGSADGYAVGEPSVTYDRLSKVYRMWYAASPSRDVKGRAVGLATSSETTKDAFGATWSKGGIVSITGSGGNYTGGWFAPGAWIEPSNPSTPLWMIFAGKKAADQPYKLMTAKSADGFAWTYGGQLLSQGNPGTWDENNVFWASMLPDPVGTLYRIYFTGSGGAGDRARNAIGYATANGPSNATEVGRIISATSPGNRFDTNQSAQGAVWQNPNGELDMFYAGRSTVDLNWRIGLATSTVEATSWAAVDGTGDAVTKAVLPLGPLGSFDASGAASASVAAVDDSATVLAMAYEGVSAAGASSIGIATSTPDAVRSWTRGGAAVISKGIAGTFDSAQVGHPSLVRTPDGMRIYYAGFDGVDWEIGVATATAGITGWQKHSSTVMTVGAAGAIDEKGVSDPVVAFEASSTTPYRMWYTAEDGHGIKRVAYATSEDGLSWTKRDLAVVPSGEPWAFDELGARAGGVWRDAATGTWHLFYDGIDRGNLGNSAGSPQVSWRRIGHAAGKDAGFVNNGQATYSLVPSGTPAPGYQYDFRDFSWDSTAPAGSSARFEVSFYPAYIMANGTPVDDWSPWAPLDGETKPMLPLTTEKIRWRVSFAREAGMTTVTPTLDEMRITWAPVHFETTGTATSIPVGPTAGKYVESWTNLEVTTLPMAATASATVTVLDTYGRTLVGPVALSGTANTVPLDGIDPSSQQLRIRFDFAGNGETTPYVKNWRLNYVSTNRAPVELFQAFGTSDGTHVAWVDPQYDGLQTTRVLRRLDGFPTSPTDGAATVVYEASSTAGAPASFDETGFPTGQIVYYTAYTTDGTGWSPPARSVAIVRPPLTKLTAVPGGASVALSWTAPSGVTTTYAGVTIAARETTPPAGPGDPSARIVARDVKTTSTTDNNARPGAKMQYAAYVHDALLINSVYYDAYSLPATASAVPLWQAPLYFDARGSSTAAYVTGRVPTSGNPTCTVVIVKNTTRVPTSPTDGSRVFNREMLAGQEITYTATGLTNMRPVWFAAYVIAPTADSTVTMTSPPARAAALPRTVRLSGFKVTPGDTRNTVRWTRPTSFSSSTYGYAYSGVRVIRGVGAYPWGVMDPSARVLVPGSTTLYTVADTGLTNLTPYGYQGFLGVKITKGSYVDYDNGVPASTMATPKYTTTQSVRMISYNRYASPNYYYAYGRSMVLTGSVSPDHATLASGSPGYVTAYVYLKKYNSRTRKYYWAVVKKANVYMTSAGTLSTWKLSYRGARGTYMLKAYFPGDANHLPVWSATKYAKVY